MATPTQSHRSIISPGPEMSPHYRSNRANVSPANGIFAWVDHQSCRLTAEHAGNTRHDGSRPLGSPIQTNLDGEVLTGAWINESGSGTFELVRTM